MKVSKYLPALREMRKEAYIRKSASRGERVIGSLFP